MQFDISPLYDYTEAIELSSMRRIIDRCSPHVIAAKHNALHRSAAKAG